MQDGAGKIGAAEIGAAQVTALQLGFPKIAAAAVLAHSGQKCIAVGRSGRPCWLILGHRGSGCEQKHESRPNPDDEAGGWRGPRGRSTMHARPLDLIALDQSLAGEEI
jgi:hypothetical protein